MIELERICFKNFGCWYKDGFIFFLEVCKFDKNIFSMNWFMFISGIYYFYCMCGDILKVDDLS